MNDFASIAVCSLSTISISWKSVSLETSLSFLKIVLGSFRIFTILSGITSNSVETRVSKADIVSCDLSNSTSMKSLSRLLALRILRTSSSDVTAKNQRAPAVSTKVIYNRYALLRLAIYRTKFLYRVRKH